MTRSSRKPQQTAQSRGDVIRQTLFVLLLVLLCVRPLISEEFERAELSFLASANTTHAGPTPATTAWLDAATLATSLAALTLYFRRTQVLRWYTLATAGLAVAVVLSSWAAGEQRIAILAGANMLIIALAGGALLATMRASWMPRLVLAALLATGVATSVKCVVQKHVDQELTRRDWEQRKAALLESGVAADDPTVVNFERRMKSGEVMGFLSHSNVTAAQLGALALITAGLLLAALRSAQKEKNSTTLGTVILGLLMIGPLLYALYLTGSMGAYIAVAGAAACLPVLALLSRWIGGRARLAATILLAGYFGIIGTGAAYGIARGTLPHTSLAFRWYYWQAAAEGYTHAGAAQLTGIGRENFRDIYQRYRPAVSTEEVRNPHNLWVSTFVELGPLGLVATITLVAGVIVGALRGLRGPPSTGPPDTRLPVRSIIATAAGLLLVQLLASGLAFMGSGASEQFAVLTLWLFEFAVVWGVVFVLAARALQSTRLDERWLGAGLVAALLAALVHNLVGFALLTPAGLSTFVLIAVCAIARGRDDKSERHDVRQRIVIALATVVFVGGWYAGAALRPTMRAGSALNAMMAGLRQARTLPDVDQAIEHGMRACTADPFDASTPRRVARRLFAIATADATTVNERRLWLESATPADVRQRQAWLEQAYEAGRIALSRNRDSSGTHRSLARIHDALATIGERQLNSDAAERELELAIRHWRRAIELFPTDPRLCIDAAETMIRAWHRTGDTELAAEAERKLRQALEVDSARPADNTSRLNAREKALIERFLMELREPARQPHLP